MAGRRTYELLVVIEAASERAARAACDAAWYAADGTTGTAVVEAVVHERLSDGRVREPNWPGWQDEASVAVRVQHFAP